MWTIPVLFMFLFLCCFWVLCLRQTFAILDDTVETDVEFGFGLDHLVDKFIVQLSAFYLRPSVVFNYTMLVKHSPFVVYRVENFHTLADYNTRKPIVVVSSLHVHVSKQRLHMHELVLETGRLFYPIQQLFYLSHKTRSCVEVNGLDLLVEVGRQHRTMLTGLSHEALGDDDTLIASDVVHEVGLNSSVEEHVEAAKAVVSGENHGDESGCVCVDLKAVRFNSVQERLPTQEMGNFTSIFY